MYCFVVFKGLLDKCVINAVLLCFRYCTKGCILRETPPHREGRLEPECLSGKTKYLNTESARVTNAIFTMLFSESSSATSFVYIDRLA